MALRSGEQQCRDNEAVEAFVDCLETNSWTVTGTDDIPGYPTTGNRPNFEAEKGIIKFIVEIEIDHSADTEQGCSFLATRIACWGAAERFIHAR